MSLKKHFTLWKPPSSKAMKLTEQDTLFTEGIIEFVEKYYYDNVRYTKRRQGLSVTNIETVFSVFENPLSSENEGHGLISSFSATQCCFLLIAGSLVEFGGLFLSLLVSFVGV